MSVGRIRVISNSRFSWKILEFPSPFTCLFCNGNIGRTTSKNNNTGAMIAKYVEKQKCNGKGWETFTKEEEHTEE